jgi:Bacterial SH3 domain
MKFASFAAFSTAAAVLTLSAVCASASPGLVNTTVNLRQGPGTSTPVLAKIPGGSTVNVAGCSGEWCQVAFAGKSGYVIAAALGQAGPPPGAPPPGYVPPPVYAGPPYPYGYYGPYYYGYGPYWRRW